jgi:hypothetical protein
MYHRWAALALVLALCALPTKQAAGQQSTTQSRERKQTGNLGQNFPNPFNPETSIPFSITDCEGGAQHTVTIRIYNVIAQLVAIPNLDGPAAPVNKLTLGCGSYVARWDGKVMNSNHEAASGVYMYELVIDGVRVVAKKMFIAK